MRAADAGGVPTRSGPRRGLRRRQSRRGPLVAGGVAGTLVAAGLALTVLEGGGGLDPLKQATGIRVVGGGPLAREVAYATVVPGDEPVFTDGQVLLLLRGEEPATITSVTSNGDDDVIELVGASISGPDRPEGATQYRPGWPPPAAFGGSIVDAVGAVVDPVAQTPGEMGYELLLGYRLTRVDAVTSARRSVTIEYTVGSTDYSYTEDAALVVCPGDGRSRRCLDELDRVSTELQRGVS